MDINTENNSSEDLSLSYFNYWGKASRNGDGFHLLPYHCLDVAAVGYAMLTDNSFLNEKLIKLSGLREDQCQYWVLLFLAAHDIGKFAESFQGLRLDLLHSLHDKETTLPYIRHDKLGAALWEQKLETIDNLRSWFGIDANESNLSKWQRAMRWFVSPSSGHHGEPPRSDGSTPLPLRVENSFRDQNIAAAASFIKAAVTLFRPSKGALDDLCYSKELKAKWRHASWLFSGFAVLCDWIGSNNEWFPFYSAKMPLERYWTDYAVPQARKALTFAGVENNNYSTPKLSFRELFPEIITPTPLQQFVSECTVVQTPQLFILEDITGSGKTEAALYLARKFIENGAAKGIFIALPTMATSNSMYGRLEVVYRKLFSAERQPSLVLAHGASHLSERFMQSIGISSGNPAVENYSEDDESASSQCNAWLADNRKKALLADVGVGTLDQALLAILPARFQSLRLFGLCRSVLIVDEVHAYDSYMNQLLQTLLTFHASLGGSAILLSATLPQRVRQRMADSFSAGIEKCAPRLSCLAKYPLATSLNEANGLVETCIEAVSHRRTSIDITIVSDEADIVKRIVDYAQQGKCVCWIKNTVYDAVTAFESLKGKIPSDKLMLFHARFAMGDRLDIEQSVCSTFGKNSSAGDRNGRVLIATQVVEQSLDLDFDCLISDLAPMDLLIQRSGRLRRHIRDEQGNRLLGNETVDLREPIPFLIHSPDPSSDATGAWFKGFFPKASYVYTSHGQLWLTARLLKEKGKIKMPDDARELIEAVFNENNSTIPAGLGARDWEAEGKRKADSALAHINELKINDGYCVTTDQWREDVKTPTRLGDSETVIRLAKWDGLRFAPWYSSNLNSWYMSQVTTRATEVREEAEVTDPDLRECIEEAKDKMPDKGKWSVLVPLVQDGESEWRGTALDKNGSSVSIVYDHETGLKLES